MRLRQFLGCTILELLLVLGLPAGTVHAAVGIASDPGRAVGFDAVEAILRDATSGGQVRGASLLVVHHGKVLYKQAVGNLSVDQQVRIASSSKPVAATAILTLVDDGKLSLSDPISKYLPEFKKTKVASATLAQLLSHTAGMPQGYPGGRPRSGSLADFSREVASRGTFGVPGDFQYSGVGIDIACRMAEAVSGVPFEEYIKERLWQPLGMTHTEFSLAADAGTLPPDAFSKGDGRYVSCGGGMSSSLDDLGAFYQMLLQHGVYNGRRILSGELIGDMFRKHAANPKKRDDPYTTGEYGLALYRDRVAPDGTPLTISHGGALGTMAWADLDRDLVGVFLSEGRLTRVMPVIVRVQEKIRELVPAGNKTSGGGGPVSESVNPLTARPSRNAPTGAVESTSRRDPRAVFLRMSEGRSTVSNDEFRDFIASHPIGERLQGRPEAIERIFRRLDENSDGQLTVDEYEKIRDLRLQRGQR
jgi:CubicO group peptidase (beta-lactamase class C family)